MEAPIKGVIAGVEQDYSRDVVELWLANGMGFSVNGHNMRRVADEFSPRDGFRIKGLVATFEQFDAEKAQREAPPGCWVDQELHGRWMLVKFEQPAEALEGP